MDANFLMNNNGGDRMDILYKVGSIGGIMFLLLMGWYVIDEYILSSLRKRRKKKTTKQKMPMGFMTEKERAEIMAKMAS